MPGCARYAVCLALAVQVLTQPACSVDPAAHPAFRGGACDAGQRNYQGFCLVEDGEPGQRPSGVMGTAGPGDGGASASAGRSGTGGGSAAEPADASASVPRDASAPNPDAAPPADSGTQVPPECDPVPESCNDRDDDCDGRSDEQIAVACYEGAAGCVADNSGGHTCVGLCRSGVRRCSGGVLGACEAQVLPASEEDCSSSELAADEDCDGRIDEGCGCSRDSQPCYSGAASTRNVPPCRPGVQECREGEFGACEGEVLPAAETCANPGVDDDCDGELDDVPLLDTLCTEPGNLGLCAAGTWQCAGDSLACATPAPGDEICDRRDQDCDGESDEDFDLRSDPSHCGACDRACSGPERCCSGDCFDLATSDSHCGECGMACAAGRTCCGGMCRDLQTDIEHCGICGRACENGQSCCGGTCVDTSSRNDHCGTCGHDCGPGMSCCGGACYDLSTAQDHCGSCTNSCVSLVEGCCRGTCRLLSLGC